MAFAIRRRVFVDEQGVDAALEYANEDQAHHYLMLLPGNPLPPPAGAGQKKA